MSDELTPVAPHEIEYLDFMAENGISKKDLPTNIQSKITQMQFALGKFRANETEANKTKVASLDADICTMIYDCIKEEEENEQDELKNQEIMKDKEKQAAEAAAAETARHAARSLFRFRSQVRNSAAVDGSKNVVTSRLSSSANCGRITVTGQTVNV